MLTKRTIKFIIMKTMANELLKFIKGEIDDLDDPKHIVSEQFEYDKNHPNGGVNTNDIMTWVNSMYDNIKYELVYRKDTGKSYVQEHKDGYYLVRYPGHLVFEYQHDGVCEVFDSNGAVQHSSNGCTLFAGIIAIIRPLCGSFKEALNVWKMVEEKPGTDGYNRLVRVSEYYFGRGIEYFKTSPTSIRIKGDKVAFIYICGLNPMGTVCINQTTEAFRKILGNKFYVYQRPSGQLRDCCSDFNNFIRMLSEFGGYGKFVVMGHSYGATFATYLPQMLIRNINQFANNFVSVSLDGSELVETCQYVAYQVLHIDRGNCVEFTESRATCDGRNIIKEWFEMIKNDFKCRTEVEWPEWYRSVYDVSQLNLNHRHIVFTYWSNEKNPDVVDVVDKGGDVYELHYGKEYHHSLHMFETVADRIVSMIYKFFDVVNE